MPPEAGILLFGGFFVLVLVVGWLAGQAAKKRQADLLALAQELGLRVYEPPPPGCFSVGLRIGEIADTSGATTQFQHFQLFQTGHSKQVGTVLTGQRGEVEWWLFDYQYTTGSGKNQSTHSHTVIGAIPPFSMPWMSIRPQNFLDTIGAAIGVRDVQFESEEFNKKYYVRASDERACFDLLHPQMLEWLLSVGRVNLEFSPRSFMWVLSGRAATSDMRAVVGIMEQFLALVPDYVREDRSRG